MVENSRMEDVEKVRKKKGVEKSDFIFLSFDFHSRRARG